MGQRFPSGCATAGVPPLIASCAMGASLLSYAFFSAASGPRAFGVVTLRECWPLGPGRAAIPEHPQLADRRITLILPEEVRDTTDDGRVGETTRRPENPGMMCRVLWLPVPEDTPQVMKLLVVPVFRDQCP